MRFTMDLRPSRLLVGVGALALAAAVGAGIASAGTAHGAPATAVGPAAPALAAGVDDSTAAAAALGLGDDTSLVASTSGLGALTGADAATAPRGAGLIRALIGKTERAEITVTTKDGEKTILYVRGKITAASGTSLTITLKDGTTQAFKLDSTTRVRGGGKVRQLSDIATDGRAQVFGLKNADGSYTAVFVHLVMAGTGPAAAPTSAAP